MQYLNNNIIDNSGYVSITTIITMRLLKVGLFVPGIKSLILKNFRIINYYYTNLYKLGQLDKMLLFIIHVLSSQVLRNNVVQINNWWFLMRIAVASLQEQQVRFFRIQPDLENQLISLAQVGPGNKIGYDVSYCYVGFALWLFEQAQIKTAVQMAKVAATADPTWGYPEYLIGWLGLFLGGQESAKHFCKAVGLNWNFLHRIKKDRTCQQFPRIIREVNKNVLVISQKLPKVE